MKKLSLIILTAMFFFMATFPAKAAYHFSGFRGRLPIHIYGGSSKVPRGIAPDQIKKMYHLPKSGGRGTIAIIGAYDDTAIETDLQTFSKKFSLTPCSTSNGCFEKHKMSRAIRSNSGWTLET